MWWKLSLLAIGTLALLLSIIPIRTHAVMLDPMREPPPARPTWGEMIANMYLTSGTVVTISIILLIAVVIAYKIVRG